MPPKGKGGKGKGKAQGVVIDGVNTSEMTREQLEVFALRLKEELEREREERNFFQLERDKLRTFWEITRSELEESKAVIRNKEREIEAASEKNDEEIKNFRQKIKYLQYEQQNKIAELKAEGMMTLKQAQEDHTEEENELLTDKKELKKLLREQQNSHYEYIQALKLEQSEEIFKARQQFETLAQDTEAKYEKIYETLRDELQTKFSMELTEVEERKNRQIAALIEDHGKAFVELKNYYNDITLNNLALINSMQEHLKELTEQNEKMEKRVVIVTAENKKILEPLRQSQEETAELKQKLQNYDKDLLTLSNVKAKYKDTVRQLEDLKWLHNTLELRFEKLQTERDLIHSKFIEGILEVKQKSGAKNILLEQKIRVLIEENENKDAVLGELVAATQLQPHAVNQKLDELLKRKNNRIKDLQYELARIAKAHDDLLRTYKDKLAAYHLPVYDRKLRTRNYRSEGLEPEPETDNL